MGFAHRRAILNTFVIDPVSHLYITINYGPNSSHTQVGGYADRAIVMRAEDVIRRTHKKGSAIHIAVTCEDDDRRKRALHYLHDVAFEVANWPNLMLSQGSDQNDREHQ
jgi:hypothetical protein